MYHVQYQTSQLHVNICKFVESFGEKVKVMGEKITKREEDDERKIFINICIPDSRRRHHIALCHIEIIQCKGDCIASQVEADRVSSIQI